MISNDIKNDLILRALDGKETERPPVWMMRQAGRFLPDFRKLRAKHSFFERVETPELATEITVMPVNQVGVDAAILFSDILVIPQALGFKVELEDGIGPVLPGHIKTESEARAVKAGETKERLSYVYDAIRMIKGELNNQVPLLGFAGAPWTILCYMVEGKGSKNFDKAKAFCYQYPDTAASLLQSITDTTITYLQEQVDAGVDAVQIFDSWGGLLSPEAFNQFSLPYIKQIVEALKPKTRVIVFAKGCWYALKDIAAMGVNGIGLDWTIKPEFARSIVGDDVTLQGNFDPALLHAPIDVIVSKTKDMVKSFGGKRHIANLGHGILPDTPVDHAKAFIDTIKAS